MDNHLFIETPDRNVSSRMRQLSGGYTQAFNKGHRTTGHLFQGRYKAILIQKESIGRKSIYCFKPCAGRALEKPGDWPCYTSARPAGVETLPRVKRLRFRLRLW